MPRIRVAVAIASAALVAPLAACVAGPEPETTTLPQPSTEPTLAPDATLTLATAVQSEGPLGDGTDGLQRDDAASLAALADVLALPDMESDDIECEWTTTTTVIATDATGATATFEASSCGATGRGAALGQLVAEWVLDDA